MADFTDPFVCAFYTDMYKKEKQTRLKWLNEYFSNLDEHDYNDPSKKLMNQFIREYKILNGKQREIDIKARTRSDERVQIKTMRPSVMKILHETDTNEFLAEIYKRNPNERHTYPMCTNWDYGWWLRDIKSEPVERRGRVNRMNARFYQRTGLVPDPEHYRQPRS